MSRVLLRLRKGEQVKYLSHLDLLRTFGYALRRACVPVAYTAGFNPRPRMSFGSALGVGVTSDDERILVGLATAEPPDRIRARLNEQLPSGLEVLSAEEVPEGVVSPLSGLNASEFRITADFPGDCSPALVEAKLGQMLASEEIRLSRTKGSETKEINIRPYVLDAGVHECKGRTIVLAVALRSGDSGGARPQDFAQALRNSVPGLDVKKIHRLRQFKV